MKHQDIANHYGLSRETVRRWPADKRLQAIADIKAGINPQLAALIGELAAACYKASMRVGDNVFFDYHTAPKNPEHGFFGIHYRKAGESELTYVVPNVTRLNCINVAGAISLVEAL